MDHETPRLVETVKGCWEVHFRSRCMTLTEFEQLMAKEADIRCVGCGRSREYCDCDPAWYK